MSIGPVEYIIIGFPGNQFTGDIAPELVKLTQSGQIQIIDLLFIMKDDAGDVVSIEFDQLEAFAPFAALDTLVGGIISDEDVEFAAAAIEPGSSVLLILWEDTWATPLVNAIHASGGVVLEGARIPRDLMDAAEAVLAELD